MLPCKTSVFAMLAQFKGRNSVKALLDELRALYIATFQSMLRESKRAYYVRP